MEQKKSSPTAWFVLGTIFIFLLFAYAYVRAYIPLVDTPAISGVVSAVFGAGGTIFLLVGLVKVIIGYFKK